MANNIKTRIDRLELQQGQDDTEWKPGWLPLSDGDFQFWIPGENGQRLAVPVDCFV